MLDKNRVSRNKRTFSAYHVCDKNSITLNILTVNTYLEKRTNILQQDKWYGDKNDTWLQTVWFQKMETSILLSRYLLRYGLIKYLIHRTSVWIVTTFFREEPHFVGRCFDIGGLWQFL